MTLKKTLIGLATTIIVALAAMGVVLAVQAYNRAYARTWLQSVFEEFGTAQYVDDEWENSLDCEIVGEGYIIGRYTDEIDVILGGENKTLLMEIDIDTDGSSLGTPIWEIDICYIDTARNIYLELDYYFDGYDNFNVAERSGEIVEMLERLTLKDYEKVIYSLGYDVR